MASNLKAMASDQIAMASTLVTLVAMKGYIVGVLIHYVEKN